MPKQIVPGGLNPMIVNFTNASSKLPLDLTTLTEATTCMLKTDTTSHEFSLTDNTIAIVGNPLLGQISINPTDIWPVDLEMRDSATLEVKLFFNSSTKPIIVQVPLSYSVVEEICAD